MKDQQDGTMGTVKKYFDQFFEIGAVVAFSGMLAAVLAEIFFRYMFSMSLTWAEELARFLGIWTVFLGSAILAKKGMHLSIDVLFRGLSGRPKLLISLFTDFLTFLFCLGLFWGSVVMIERSSNIMSPALQISTSYFYLALIIGVIGMLIYLLTGIISTTIRLFHK